MCPYSHTVLTCTYMLKPQNKPDVPKSPLSTEADEASYDGT